MEIRNGPTPKKEPRSRRTKFATIITDATEDHPAFESDAFAVQMPTTREPIIDTPPSPAFRVKMPNRSKAQVEAYQTYNEKAKRDAKRLYKKECIPTKVVSCDYAYASGPAQTSNPNPLPLELTVSPTSSSPTFSPGAFPASPSVPQHQRTQLNVNHLRHVSGPRSISDPSNILIPRKPIGLGNTTSRRRRYRYQEQRADVEAGASCSSPSPFPDKIKVRIKPKASVTEADRLQKESWWGLYERPLPTRTKSEKSYSSTTTSFSASPTKAVFGYTTKDIVGTLAATTSAKTTPTMADKETTAKSKSPSRSTLTSRLAWLRPAGPRVNKPAAAHNSDLSIPTATTTAYVDPFVLHATPLPTHAKTQTSSRPNLPKKIIHVHAHPPVQKPEKGKFETGLAQVKGLTILIVKLCIFIYLLVGLYFVLDAIREAMHAFGAPFRAIKMVGRYIWIGSIWVAKVMAKGWGRWGIKVVMRGGWR
ncbi:hypothetical protein K469DRAFT_627220 [Zopfia rhizophila CBS 207.26]|uniref:Uncharacterized protein n=1 Tax=Zopfia rhizophila CBS 207.26 TaxID=1314779 RepID=A0A6A6EFH0_9PEZI|nr:hypothetical protein K469DRAFT_627220 [Zopfia rhizophila CBS 207.26]